VKAEAISLISTPAVDVLVDARGQTISRQRGGPVRFIEAALKAEQVNYELSQADSMEVEILVNDEGEFGKVPTKPTPRSITALPLKEWSIVSTILDEWQIGGYELPPYLFIDLQGYVRDGDDFGKKVVWSPPAAIAKQIFCLKGTEEEMTYIPKEVYESQRDRLLVTTRGADGVAVTYKGETKNVPTQPVSGLKDTIGAGDTFLGYFVSSMYHGHDPVSAAKYANVKTGEFLTHKQVSMG
jgi:hypothetical protein